MAWGGLPGIEMPPSLMVQSWSMPGSYITESFFDKIYGVLREPTLEWNLLSMVAWESWSERWKCLNSRWNKPALQLSTYPGNPLLYLYIRWSTEHWRLEVGDLISDNAQNATKDALSRQVFFDYLSTYTEARLKFGILCILGNLSRASLSSDVYRAKIPWGLLRFMQSMTW